MRRAGLLLALLAAACNESNDAGMALPVDPGTIYTQMCARCHGVDGHGDAQLKLTMPIRDFSAPPFRAMSNEEIERVIMSGRNQMPAFGAMLSLPKLQSVTGYVKRLGAK